MLDFRQRVQTRNFLSRQERRRLFAWVMGIGLVILVCVRFREIGMVLGGGAQGAPSVDTRYRPGNGGSNADVVTFVNPDEPAPRTSRDLFSGIDPSLLSRVRDDTPWIRNDEIDAWWSVWSVLVQSESGDLSRASAGEIGFVEMFQQPKAFRGRALTVRGSARQVTYMTAGENQQGIKGYYRLIIWPENGPAEPIFVYALELPEGFPTGEETNADIQATGIFFKRMVYTAQDNDELRRAPVIMAPTIQWRRAAVASEPLDSAPIYLLLLLTALGVIALAAVMAWASRGSGAIHARRGATPQIDENEIVDVRASLRKLAESEQ
jgi:hypothetical protein